MMPSPPKPPAPPPKPPTIDDAAKAADQANLIRMRQGYAATVLSRGGAAGQPSAAQTRTGTAAILGQ
jgi:hypothetical protein